MVSKQEKGARNRDFSFFLTPFFSSFEQLYFDFATSLFNVARVYFFVTT
ncbi:hypothetical protein DFP93_106122, partial [Aneurinibacillus soli]